MDAGWDGEWYLRAYDHYKNKIGSKECEDGKIFIEPQGFCVMAEIGLEDREWNPSKNISTRNTVSNSRLTTDIMWNLVRFLLITGCKTQVSSVTTTHGSLSRDCNWDKLQAGSTCPAYIEDISEIHRTEPYVYSQMIAGKDAPNFGEAKNSWLTGTAAWTFLDVSQFILGIRPDYDGLTVDPCIPSKLDGFTAKRDFRGVSYHITVKNPNHVEKGVVSMIVDGQPVEGTTIPFSAEKKDVNVEVTMG